MCAKSGRSARRIRNVCSRAAGVLIVLLTCSLALASYEYDAGTAITDVSITNPTANQFWGAGSSHTLTCTAATDTDWYRDSPEDSWHNISDSVTHYWTGTGTFQDNDNVGTSVTYICTISPGSNTVTVYADDNYAPVSNDAIVDETAKSDSETVTIVTVAKIQWNNGGTWTDVSGTMNVATGTTVAFKAIPAPTGASWPSGTPVWGYNASGTGETKDVTYNAISSSTSDYKIVGARCGSEDWVRVNAIVFDFVGTTTPADNFTDRSQDRFGLEEQVTLGVNTSPAGVSIGSVEWTKTSGVGQVSGTSYDAQHVAGGVTLRVTITSGPSSGKYRSLSKTVVAPSGTRMTRVNPNTVWHNQGTASAGIALYYWLDPTDVSFRYLTFGEDSCPITNTSGIFVGYSDHQQNTFGAILGGNSTNGCRVSNPDNAWLDFSTWGDGGSGTWSIPTQYIDDTSTRHTFGNNQNHVATIQANGTTTIAKGGQSGSAAVTDPSSGF